jgi:hypothetical protein
MGVKRTSLGQRRMSALPPKSGHVRCTGACTLCANSGHDAFTAKLVSVPLRYGDRRIAGETVYNSIPTAKIVMM